MTKKTTGNKTVHNNPTSGRGEGPNPIDIHVGHRLTQLRTMRGLTQGKLGEAIGVSFQQIQKYERGANRISASKLYQIAGKLDEEVGFFFADMPDAITKADNLRNINLEELAESYDDIHRRQQLELNRIFSNVQDPKLRKQFLNLAITVFAQSEQQVA